MYCNLFSQFLSVLHTGYSSFLISESSGANALAVKIWHISLLIFLPCMPGNGIASQGLCIFLTFPDLFASKVRNIQYLEALKLCEYLRCEQKETF